MAVVVQLDVGRADTTAQPRFRIDDSVFPRVFSEKSIRNKTILEFPSFCNSVLHEGKGSASDEIPSDMRFTREHARANAWVTRRAVYILVHTSRRFRLAFT